MNTAWNRWCRNLPSSTALSLYENRITPIIITDITGRRNVRIQNPYTCTTSSGHSQILSRSRGDKIWEWPGDEASTTGSAPSLVPRPFPPPVFYRILYAIKNWRRERPGNEASPHPLTSSTAAANTAMSMRCNEDAKLSSHLLLR